jgi:hypothetical protein
MGFDPESEFKIGDFTLTGWHATIAIVALISFIFLLGFTAGALVMAK